MNILVVAATEVEIAPFLAQNSLADVLITGVGVPACMYALTKKLAQKKYDLVIQAGIAGTFKSKFLLGKTFAVKKDLFADLGIHENAKFYTLFEKGFTHKDEPPFFKGKLVNATENFFSLTAVNAITVNTVSDNYLINELYQTKYDADIESMEGAAFHYVCLQESVPFLQIRSISNFVGERVKTNWKMKESIQNLNDNLCRIIKTAQQ
ncbi:MAG: futalosine hydrolase [Ferruginibacter sp.]|nr:futalosine hydrolase [Ferruginibacter sp.]